MRTRLLAHVLFVVLAPLTIGCGSDKKSGSSGSSWAGKTYLVNIPETRWKKPKGQAGKEFGAFVPKFLFNIENGSNGVDVLLGTSDVNGTQNLCSPTTSIHTASPETQIGPTNAKVHVANGHGSSVVAPVYDLTFTNILTATPDAGGLTGQFKALLDVRDAYELFYQVEDPTPDSICATSATFESPCIACPESDPNDTKAYCLELNAVSLAAVPLSDKTVEIVEAEDVAPSCETHAASDAGT